MICDTGSMTNVILQGTPLLPVLRLIYMATTLTRIDARIQGIQLLGQRQRNANRAATVKRVLLHCYVDDIRPFIITPRS